MRASKAKEQCVLGTLTVISDGVAAVFAQVLCLKFGIC